MSFNYMVSQLGLRDMEQAHRVYRSGTSERDETLVVDGYTLKRPTIRIIAGRVNRYDIARIAPDPENYAFAYLGRARSGGGTVYRFATSSRSESAFAVDEIDLDTRAMLPAVVRFHIAGSGARGKGTLFFSRAEGAWLVREARVTATLATGAVATERIAWSNYHFYSALPPATFAAPLPTATLPPTP